MNANILVETEGLSREEWLRYRKCGIGGSDVAAILGISKWNSAISLWLDKTNQTYEPVEENEAMQWGNIMEPIIRNHFAEVTGKTVVEVKAMLLVFDKVFDKMNDADKRKLLESMIAEVHLHPKETWQEGKNPIKEIKYAFPVSQEVMEALRENVASVESVVLMSRTAHPV